MPQYGYLSHHGIKGQKWGIRRYQNADGSLTAEGIARYGGKGIKKKHLLKDSKGSYRLTDKGAKFYNKYNKDNKLNSGDKVQLEKYATALSKSAKKKAAIGAVSAIATIGIGSAIAVKCIKNGKSIADEEVEKLSDNDVDILKPDFTEPDYIKPDIDKSDYKDKNDNKINIFDFDTKKISKGGVIDQYSGMRLMTEEEAKLRESAEKEVNNKINNTSSGRKEYHSRIKETLDKLKQEKGIKDGDFDKSMKYEHDVEERANEIARQFDTYKPNQTMYDWAKEDVSKKDPEGAKIHARVKSYETDAMYAEDRVKEEMIKEKMRGEK